MLMKKLRREVGTVTPRQSMTFQGKRPKKGNILQWLEYFAVQFMRQVDLALDTIIERQPYLVITDVSCFFDV